MARCGCSGACSCYVVGGDSITVTGNGSATSPYKFAVDFNKTDANICKYLLRNCGTKIAGDGLQYNPSPDPGTIGLLIDPKTDNGIKIGTDGGLYVPSSAPRNALLCSTSVATLPRAPWSVSNPPVPPQLWANHGIGPVTTPQELIRSVRDAVAAGITNIILYVSVLADGAVVVVPYSSFESAWTADPCSVAPWHLSGATVVNNPACIGTSGDPDTRYLPYPTYKYWEIGIAQWKNLLVTSETWADASQRNQWGANTVMEILDEVGGKVNICWAFVDENPGTLETNLLRCITRTCTKESTVVATYRYGRLAPFTAAGIKTGVIIESAADVTANPKATVLAAGVTYAFVSQLVGVAPNGTNAPFQEATAWKTAGFTSIATYSGRRGSLLSARTAGVDGVGTEDGTYTTRIARPMVKDPWVFGAMVAGQVHEQIDVGGYRTRLRGWPTLGGWALPPYPTAAGRALQLDKNRSITVAWATPLPLAAVTTTDRLLIQWEQMWANTGETMPPTTDTSAGLGFMLLMETDRAISDHHDDVSSTLDRVYMPNDYYWCRHEVDGKMTISGVFGGVTIGPAQTATGTNFAPTAGTWISFEVEVTNVGVTFRRTSGTGATQTVSFVGGTAHATMRTGLDTRYLGMRKTKGTPTTATSFNGYFRNVRVSPIQ